MREKVLNDFMQKSNCERLGIIASTIEKLLKEFSTGEQSLKTLEAFYESLFAALERGFFEEPEMDCVHCYDFNSYLRLLHETSTGNKSPEHLSVDLQYMEKMKAQLVILENMRPPLDNFDLRPAAIDMENCLYLDFNIYDSIEKQRMTDLLEGINAVYSPIHLEEAYRMADERYIAIFKDTLVKVTGCHIILQMGNKFQVYKEHPERSFERVLDNLELSKAFENERLTKAGDRDVFFKDIYEKYRQDINKSDDIFETVTWDEISMMLQSSGCYLNKEDFKGAEEMVPDEILSRIYALYNMMDNLSYFRDKKKKDGRTYRSAVYDIEHLRYAANCRYFVTRDEKLSKRARQIFNFMQVRTEVIFINEPSKINVVLQELIF